MTETDSIYGISRDSRWQQSGATHILINAIHWPQRLCSAPYDGLTGIAKGRL